MSFRLQTDQFERQVKSIGTFADARSGGPQRPDERGSAEGFEPLNKLRFAIRMRSPAPNGGSVYKSPEQFGASLIVAPPTMSGQGNI